MESMNRCLVKTSDVAIPPLSYFEGRDQNIKLVHIYLHIYALLKSKSKHY